MISYVCNGVLLESNVMDIGYSMRYWIPSTIFDVAISDNDKIKRQRIMQTLFASNYGGCTMDTWNARYGSYLSYLVPGKIINEEISVIETFITEVMWNNTKNELFAALILYNCVMFEQESFLYHYNYGSNNNAQIVFCDEKQIKSIGIRYWSICCNEKEINCAIYFENNLNRDQFEYDICVEMEIDCSNYSYYDQCQTNIISQIQSFHTNCQYTQWSTQQQCFLNNGFNFLYP